MCFILLHLIKRFHYLLIVIYYLFLIAYHLSSLFTTLNIIYLYLLILITTDHLSVVIRSYVRPLHVQYVQENSQQPRYLRLSPNIRVKIKRKKKLRN